MTQVLSLWLFANSALLFGLSAWCLVLFRNGSRRRALLLLALVSAFLGLFTYVASSSLAGPGVTFNLLGKTVLGAVAVLAPALALFGFRFARQPRRSHA